MPIPDLPHVGNSAGKTWIKNPQTMGFLLLAAYFLAGLIYSALLAPAARFPDETEYLKLSDHLLHGPGYSMDGVHLTACRPPGYAFFLSAIRAVGGGYFCFRAIQFLLVVATIALVSRLASAKKMVAGLLIATALVICYPILFYTSATLYPQTLAAFLFVLALTFTLASPGNLPLNVVAGLSFGALILVVPTFLFTLVLFLAAALLLKLIRWRDAFLITIVASCLIGAWSLRNIVVLHHFVPVATNSGLNFLAANNENAIAYQGAAVDAMVPYYQTVAAKGWDEFQADAYYRHVALMEIQNRPAIALLHYFERVLNFFNLVNAYAAQNHEELSAGKQIVQATSYALLLVLLAWRLCEVKRFPLIPREKLFLAVYLLSAFTSAIFLTRIRLRLPYDYLIIAVVSLHLSRRLELWLAAKPLPKIHPVSPLEKHLE